MRVPLTFILCCVITARVSAAQSHAARPADAVPTEGEAAFETIRRMVGEWRAPLGKDTMTAVFRPIAYGTAIQAEEWVGGKQYTTTLFYLVGGELRADHFCDFKNQPRYVGRLAPDRRSMVFTLREITGLGAHPRHFRATTWRFIYADHVTQDWQIAERGRDVESMRLEFTRQRPSSERPASPAGAKP